MIDSTCLKVFGEGEWQVFLHGYSKRRTWQKLHWGIYKKTQEIFASAITTKDTQILGELVTRIAPRKMLKASKKIEYLDKILKIKGI